MEKIKIVALGLALFAQVACQRSDIQHPDELQAHTPIEVPLELLFDEPLSVSRAQSAPQTDSLGALTSEVSVGAIDDRHSKAVDENKVANVWVLQFDGTAPTAKLIYKHYVASYTAGSTVTVLRAKTANRVAVVANSFDAAWANSFFVGTATWASVSGAVKGVSSQADVLKSSGGTEYLPMSGSATAVIAGGGAITIPLTRTVVKLTINIRSGADLAATALDVQLCNVPNTTNVFADGGTGVWPASPTVISYAAENVTGISTASYHTLTYWIPVNRRGNVAGTVGITRVTNAPALASYLKVVFGSITYTIHLGGDFLTDYNLKGNTAYSYSLTLQTDPAGTDSRVSDQRTLGTLVQVPAGNIAAVGATVAVTSPSAMAGLVWGGSTNPAAGFVVGALSGSGPTGSMPVVVGVNPTGAVRTSVFTATAINSKSSTITLSQLASAFSSSVPATEVGQGGATVDITVTGTAGLDYKVSKTSGDGGINLATEPTTGTIPAGGSATVPVVVPVTTSSSTRQAVFRVTCTNSGTTFSAAGHTVKQKAAVPTVPNPPTASDIVTIDGLQWTKGNLVAVNGANCKVGSSTDYGLYFKFGSLVGWRGGTGDGTGQGHPALGVQVEPSTYRGTYDWLTAGRYTEAGTAGTGYGLPATDAPITGIGDPCRFYLGDPWRTPTATEYKALFANVANNTVWGSVPGWNWQATPAGAIGPSSLFFPASGARDNTANGSFYSVGASGTYWSSSVDNALNGSRLFSISGSVSPQFTNERSYGFPVRCVVPLPINPPAASDYVTLDLLRWTKGNLVAKNTNECQVGAPTDYGVYFQFGSLVGWTGGNVINGDGTGQGKPATVDKAVWPTAMGASKPSYAWQGKDAIGTSTLADYYFNYSVDSWKTPGQNIRDFAVSISGDSGSGTLADGRYAALGVGDPCTYYLGAPWRLPTTTELASITDKTGSSGIGWTTSGLTGRWAASGDSFDGVSGPGGWFGSPLSAGSGTPSSSVNPFFPVSGLRENFDGAFNLVAVSGYYWSSSVYHDLDGYPLGFSSNWVSPQSFNSRSSGYPVRCVSSVP